MTKRPTEIEDEQRRIAELVRSFDVSAPESLHRQVESLVATHQERHAARRVFSPVGLAGAGAMLAAVVAAAIAVGLSDGGSAPTVSFSQAAAPTLGAATLPAPPESSAHRAQLAAAVDGVPFPYWEDRFGWRSTGSRTDRVDGRSITTVFYADSNGRRIGYAILAGTPVPRVGGGVIAWRGGVSYRLLTENGASAVTWLRDGHLCVISGHGVSSATLLRLARWSERDATAS
ncbi:MAG TPA: hypothetical protein VKG38_19415 [Solirubrobacteraceae bacterium]|nr:hypothetical protein [Solirubrobacteraceae bacterium]